MLRPTSPLAPGNARPQPDPATPPPRPCVHATSTALGRPGNARLQPGSGSAPRPAPVRLVAPDLLGPFLAGRGTVFARVEGEGLAALEIHDGDHVVLERREVAEHGDIAAVLDEHGQATLWKVYPEAGALRLSTGRAGEERRLAPPPRIHGVVVALLRKPRDGAR